MMLRWNDCAPSASSLCIAIQIIFTQIVANALFLNRPIVNFFADALNESGNLPIPSDHDFKAQVTIEVWI